MKTSHFDNLPSLTKKEALHILSTPSSQLELSSDYYKAVFHLYKYPGPDTEKVLIDLLKSDSKEQAVVIAKRKAVEVLARTGCINAIPIIGKCLCSDDIYLVENAALALPELGCKDSEYQNKIGSLLEDPKQNRRALIQSLSKMGAVSELSRIKLLVNDYSLSPDIRGASIAAIARLENKYDQLSQLEEYLLLPNQNYRHCAVQDIIDVGKVELLPAVLRSPVAPSFRIRALNNLWKEEIEIRNNLKLFSILDKLIKDDPNDLDIVHCYETHPSTQFLVEELFQTDFSRAYLALRTLYLREKKDIWLNLASFLDRINKDYGALYFVSILFRLVDAWDDFQVSKIEEIMQSCLDSKWPDFMKFRPSAILTLMELNSKKYQECIGEWLNEEKTPFWVCRYSALMSLENQFKGELLESNSKHIAVAKNDSNRFVRAKAKKILLEL